MKNSKFLLQSVALDFGIQGTKCVTFLSPNSKLNKTHITLIAGVNGTSKSRMLAAIVEKIASTEYVGNKEGSKRYKSLNRTGLICTQFNSIIDGKSSTINTNNSVLPSRVLALSNLVNDRFHFPKDIDDVDNFYHYLGVRQSSNLTTTGSVERSISEAVIGIISDEVRFKSFENWINLVFGRSVELGFLFNRNRISDMNAFFASNNPKDFLYKRMKSRLGTERAEKEFEKNIDLILEEVSGLYKFLNKNLRKLSSTEIVSKPLNPAVAVMRFVDLNSEDRIELSKLLSSFATASKIGLNVWPSLCIEGGQWIPFGNLSSGEQNILSVGAKLIAHSRPGCLIVIDEPEVSLNVVWQQHYIDLVLKSLSHAPNSHVLIATHSPHLISSLPNESSSILLIEKDRNDLNFRVVEAKFEGWGSESVLYQVLGIPSASSFQLNLELSEVLKHIQEGGQNKRLIENFLDTVSKLEFGSKEPLGLVVSEIKNYLKEI